MNEKFTQIVMGVDPGLNSTGWSIVSMEGSKLSYVASGSLDINSKLSLPEKLLNIYTNLCDIITKYKPQVFAIEETYVNDNPISSLKLGQARGVAIVAAAKANLKVYEYAARFVKKSIVGNGKADKVQVATMVNHLLKYKVSDHNEADALAIAICHLTCNKFNSRVSESEQISR
jgi:crossover junction endodeoxyribonuclease RuvC